MSNAIENDLRLIFNEETIRLIFGHEAAEDEDQKRLKQYYVKTDLYNTMKSALNLYILVGHKGVGKFALLTVLNDEDKEQGNISVVVESDDVLEIDTSADKFLQRIRSWKDGLASIVFNKLITSTADYMTRFINKGDMSSWFKRFGDLAAGMAGKKSKNLQSEHISLRSSQLVTLFKNSLFREKRLSSI
ncbi:hypothetical protein NOM01_16725, partial [Sporolactobacillus sp. STSJ-5]|uniref:hypothetical protein n=1 Tax=Sporolactobacillus sp. STSJ-5 TaxID=2965076 RepID=UPI002101FC12